MQTALLLVAHGSRVAESNDEVRRLTESVRRLSDGYFNAVACAFLELAEPSIPDGIEGLIASGAQHVTVLPYFLAAGRHVAEDIPAQVEQKRSEHPNVDIVVTPYFGTADAVPHLLFSLATETRT